VDFPRVLPADSLPTTALTHDAAPCRAAWRPISAAMLCMSTLLGFGCASTTAAETVQPQAAAPAARAPLPSRASRALVAEPSSVEVSPYRDDGAATAPTGSSGDGLVGALASSYESDMQALAAMQLKRTATKASLSAAALPDVPLPAIAPTPSTTPAPSPVPPTVPPTVASPKPPTSTPSADAAKPEPTPTPATTAPQSNTAASIAPPPAANAAEVAPAPSAPAAATQANTALELPPAVPTDSKALGRLLADSLAREGAASETPLQSWFGFAALAINDPTLELPKGFGDDLLPAERERVLEAHAAFMSLGRALREGRGNIDRATIDRLTAALGGGPKLAIPKVELCTRVESFGRFDAIATKRFPARRSTRFIAYTELDGFTSLLEQGKFTTRLATRVSIEAQSDGTEVWTRSPEWTAVVDASEVRRTQFFVGEIVTLSDSLSVGGYLLKVTVRDESTGASVTSSMPFQIVADSGFASAPTQ